MKIASLLIENTLEDQFSSRKLINSLKNGGVAGLPTETVYGLGGNAYLKKSVEKIFELKGRPKNNPLIIHYHNLNDAKNDIEINNFLVNLYDHHYHLDMVSYQNSLLPIP